MNTRLELVERGIDKCDALKKAYPALPILDSISNQLRYIKSVVAGEEVDRSRLSDVIIGVQTVREIETIDQDAAEIFHRISELVDELQE